MTQAEFNEKYQDYLEEGHYGLDIYDEEFVGWLNKEFEEFIKIPGFTYSQIKSKFGYGRFYCTNLSNEEVTEVENKITELFRGIL